jgi:hypothetical protein
MLMRITLIIDDRLLKQARMITGIQKKTALVRAGLEALHCARSGYATGRAGRYPG